MERIEIREPTQGKRVPRIDNNPSAIHVAARPSRSLIWPNTLRRGGLVKRLGEGVVELSHQVRPACVVGHLQRVVVGGADVPPRIERAELIMEKRVRP